ncbi:MAG: hypothetical protein ACTHOU_05625, partial [Aureliella sp.]
WVTIDEVVLGQVRKRSNVVAKRSAAGNIGTVPILIHAAGPKATRRYFEFFTANIRNRNKISDTQPLANRLNETFQVLLVILVRTWLPALLAPVKAGLRKLVESRFRRLKLCSFSHQLVEGFERFGLILTERVLLAIDGTGTSRRGHSAVSPSCL